MFDLEKLLAHLKKSAIEPKYQKILGHFISQYAEAIQGAPDIDSKKQQQVVLEFIDAVEKQCTSPYEFAPFHAQIRAPYDHLAFGCAFIEPLIDLERSKILGHDQLQKIESYLKKGESVVFFSNHQIEADPHIIFSLLKNHPFASEIIFVAGERVVLDPLAVPLSLGCNLLCIFSKKHINHPPEKKGEKQEHNRKTMQVMRERLDGGGACIWVAPSGGRDRREPSGKLAPAPFDAQSIEMFHLIAKKSKQPVHFFPLSISAYDILPPPEGVQVALGEKRHAERAATGLFIGEELELEAFADSKLPKQKQRLLKAERVYQIVKRNYDELCRDL